MMMTTTKRAAVAMLAAGLMMATASPAAAQEQLGCFRGKPLPDCKTFWIVEMQGLIPLAQNTRTVTSGGDYAYTYQAKAFENQVEWNVGHMVNVGDKWAVGGAITVGTGGHDPFTGLRVRGRRWLGKDLSVEIEAGVLSSDAAWDATGVFNGWTSDVRLNIRDQGSFFLRYDGVTVPEQSYPYNNFFDPGATHHGLSLGASAGSVPALVGTGSLAILYAVLIGVYLRYD